jgi:hypothetical protein
MRGRKLRSGPDLQGVLKQRKTKIILPSQVTG